MAAPRHLDHLDVLDLGLRATAVPTAVGSLARRHENVGAERQQHRAGDTAMSATVQGLPPAVEPPQAKTQLVQQAPVVGQQSHVAQAHVSRNGELGAVRTNQRKRPILRRRQTDGRFLVKPFGEELGLSKDTVGRDLRERAADRPDMKKPGP